MQSLTAVLRRARERLRSDGAAAPGAAGAPEPREKDRDGLHGAAAGGDPARLQRRWWQKKLRIKWRKAKKRYGAGSARGKACTQPRWESRQTLCQGR